MDSSGSATSKVTVTYWDPSAVFSLLSPELYDRLPLKNLHWKSSSRPLRSIHSLRLDLVNGNPPQTLSPTSDPSSTANNAPASSPVGSVALSRTQSTDSTSSMPATTTSSSSTNQHKSSPSLSVIHSSKHSTSTPNLGTVPGQTPGKQRRHQIPGLKRTPYLKVYFLRCDDNDTYRGTVRKQLKEWIAQNCTTAGAPPTSSSASGSTSSGSGSGSSGKGGRHDAFEWLVVHVVLPGTAAASQPRLSSQGSSSNRSSSPGNQSGSSSGWRIKSSGTVIEKIRNDVSAATKKNTSRVVQIRLSHPSPSPPPGAAVTTTPLPTPAEKEADYASLINHMKSLILTSFDARVQQYEDDIIAKSNQQHLPGWNFCTFFLLKEGLAGAFESVGLLEDAGTIYHELAVAGEMVVRGEEKGREGGDTFLKWSGEAIQTLKTEGRRFKRREMKIRRESIVTPISTNLDIPEEFDPLDEESSILSSTRKPYRELILSSNISVFDFLCYVFTRQIALLMSLASSLPIASIPVHPATAGATYSFSSDPATAAEEQSNSPDRDGHTAYLADVVRRGIEFLRMAGAVLRVELWAAWNSLENPDRPSTSSTARPSTSSTAKKSLEGLRSPENGESPAIEEDINIPREYANVLINNIVSSFITTGTLHLLHATEHPALPQLNTNVMLRETPLSPPPTPSLNETFGENPSSKPRQPSPLPSIRAKSATIYTDTGKGLGIARDAPQRPEVEELAGVRAEAVSLAKGIVLELAGGRWNWNQDEFKEMPPPEDDMEDVDLNGEAIDDSSSHRNSFLIDKDSWLYLWGIRNKSLRHALGSESGFLQVFERMSEVGLKLCTTANRKKSAERILADLATLRFHAKDYETAVRYFQELTPFYTSQGWPVIESSLLSIYAICLKKMSKYDEYFAIVVQLLRKHAADEKLRLQSIMHSTKPAYLQPKYYGDPEEEYKRESLMSPVSIRSMHGGHNSASLLSIVKELSEKIHPSQLAMEVLWTDLMMDPFPTMTENGSAWRARVKWRWLISQEILLMNGKLTLAMLDGSTAGRDKEIVLESHNDVIVKKGRGGAWFDCNMILPSRFKPIRLELSINNITFIHNFPRDHPPLLIYASPSAPSASLHLPKTISLDKVRNVEIRIDTGETTVLEAEILVKSMTAGLRIMVGEATLIDTRDKDEYRKVKMESEHASEGVLILKPEVFEDAGIPNCRLGIPYKSDGDLNELSLQLELSYKTEKGSFTYLSSPTIPVSLPLAVNVQDVFKRDALFSKFQVSAASHVPLRVISSSLSSSDLYHTQTGLGIVNSVVVFPKQPSNFLYKITRKVDGKPMPETRKPLTLRIEYRTFVDEVELAILDALQSHLRDANFSRYATLLSSAFAKKLKNSPATELNAAALVGSVRLGMWEEHEALFTSALEGIPATGRRRERVLETLKSFFRVDDDVEEEEVKPGDIRASGEVGHDGKVKRKKKKTQKRIPLLTGGPKVADITRSIDIPVEIPALQVLCTARLELLPTIREGEEARSSDPMMVTLGEAIPARLYVSYTRAWDPKSVPRTILATDVRSESPADMDEESDDAVEDGRRRSKVRRSKQKGPPLSLFYDITTTSTLVSTPAHPPASPNPATAAGREHQQQVQNDWLISGKRRATFQAYEDEEVVFNFILMPMRAGYLLFPGVEVKGSQIPYIDGERRGSTIIKDNSGGLTFTCETDYRSAAAEVMVVAEVASTTVKIQPEISGRPGSAGNLSGVVGGDGGEHVV